MKTSHLDPIRKAVRSLRKVPPPQPWRQVAAIAVGGLRAVGFDRGSELLLIVSSGGRGVVDCQTGAKLARDDADYYKDAQNLEAEGIGPLEGKAVRIAGVCGGGLTNWTADGWSMELVTLHWPTQEVLLMEPYSTLYDSLQGKPNRFHKIGSDSEFRAYGFSSSGRTLVLATSSEVLSFVRDDA